MLLKFRVLLLPHTQYFTRVRGERGRKAKIQTRLLCSLLWRLKQSANIVAEECLRHRDLPRNYMGRQKEWMLYGRILFWIGCTRIKMCMYISINIHQGLSQPLILSISRSIYLEAFEVVFFARHWAHLMGYTVKGWC